MWLKGSQERFGGVFALSRGLFGFAR